MTAEARDGEDSSDSLNTIYECFELGDTACIKLKVLNNLNKVLGKRSFKFMEGVEIEKLPGSTGDSRAMSDEELESSLPANLEEKEGRLDKLLMSGVSRMLQSHALKLSLIPGLTLRMARSDNSNGLVDFSVQYAEGGRKIMKKIGPMLLLPVLFKASLIPVAGFLLKVFAFKALVVSKIAFLISALTGLKNILGKKKKETIHVEYHGHSGHSGHHHRRSDEFSVPDQLAYAGQIAELLKQNRAF